MNKPEDKPEEAQPPEGETAPDQDAPDREAAEEAAEEVAEETAAAGDAPASGGKSPEEEIAELKDKLLRALAENENTLRRARKEREDTAKFATANMARDILSVADNLRRAIEAIPDDLRPAESDESSDESNDGDHAAKGLVDGVELTERELLATLERHGIRKIDAMGEKFDHNFHEAMFEVPTADAEPGTVVQVVQMGYVIHDRLLRAAKVGLAKALPDSGAAHEVDTTA